MIEEPLLNGSRHHDASKSPYATSNVSEPNYVEGEVTEENIIVVPNAFDPKPMAIHHLAYQRENELLAVSRFSRFVQADGEGTKSSIKGSVGKIEIWGTSPLYRCKQTIYLSGQFSSVEGLCWYKNRLFSCGTHGHLVEYDLEQEKIKKWTSVAGGTKWCMAIHEATDQIAVGSEDGFVVLLKIYNETVEVEKMLDRQDDRVLCVAWSPDGSKLVTGSPNSVRIWDVKTGQAYDRISIGKSKSKEETIVWCTAFLDDTSFATGDSKGRVCIWDSKMGVCSETHQTKLQQVQCLALVDEKIYCGGVGKEIPVLLKTHGDYSTGWKVAAARNVHLHDVRALAAISDCELISGGVDSYLIATNAPPVSINVIPPFSGLDVSFAPGKRLVMVRCIDYVAVHSIPEDGTLASMHLRFNTSSPIISYGISHDGKWCALSTAGTSKIFALHSIPDNLQALSANLMAWPSDEYKAFRHIHFSALPDDLVAVVRKDGKIGILKLSTPEIPISELLIINVSQVLPEISTISMIRFTNNTFIVADFSGNVAICKNVLTSSAKSNWKLLPKYKHEVTSIITNAQSNIVTMIYADGQISEFRVDDMLYKILEAKNVKEDATEARGSSLTSACCHYSNDNFFMSVDSSSLLGYNKLNMRLHSEGKGQSDHPGKLTADLGKFLIAVCQMPNGDICVINTTHEKLLKKLPPLPIAKSVKRYL